MDQITLTEIFFTITAAAVIFITILLAIGIIYLISIFRTIRRAVHTAEVVTEIIRDDVGDLHDQIKQKGLSLGVLASFFKKLGRRGITNRKK